MDLEFSQGTWLEKVVEMACAGTIAFLVQLLGGGMVAAVVIVLSVTYLPPKQAPKTRSNPKPT